MQSPSVGKKMGCGRPAPSRSMWQVPGIHETPLMTQIMQLTYILAQYWMCVNVCICVYVCVGMYIRTTNRGCSGACTCFSLLTLSDSLRNMHVHKFCANCGHHSTLTFNLLKLALF